MACQFQIGLGSCPADCFCRTELAPLTALHDIAVVHGHLRLRCDLVLSPAPKLCQADLFRAYVIKSRLDDCHPDGVEVVEIAEELSRSQSIETELRVAYSVDLDSLAVLQVAHLNGVAGDDHRVSGSEAVRHPLVVTEALLDHELSIRTAFDHLLGDDVEVEVRRLIHLSAVVLELTTGLFQLFVKEVAGSFLVELSQLQLCQCVSLCSLGCVCAATLRRALLSQVNRSGAVDPTV